MRLRGWTTWCEYDMLPSATRACEQFTGLVLYINSRLTWLHIGNSYTSRNGFSISAMEEAVGRCSTLRQLQLSFFPASGLVDMMTRLFSEGRVKLTHLTWSSKGYVGTDEQQLLVAMRQWLLASPTLVHVCFNGQKYHAGRQMPAYEAFKDLLHALVQRGEQGRPVQHVELWKYPNHVVSKLRRFVAEKGLKDVVVLHGCKYA